MPQSKVVKSAKYQDPKYVSLQPHEIKHIAKVFKSANGESIPVQAFYFIHYLITVNKGKVLRSDLYLILETMGYKK